MSRTLSPDDARERARDILDDARFGGAPKPPGFVRRILDTIGDGVNRALDAAARFVGWLAPGSGLVSALVWIAFVGAGVLLLLAVARRTRLRRGSTREAAAGGAAALDMAALERAADDAESGGRYDEAVRLRFAAGLARLEQRHAVRVAMLRTNHQVAAQLAAKADPASARLLTTLGDRLDDIVHGSAVATREDAIDARTRWSDLHRSFASNGADRDGVGSGI